MDDQTLNTIPTTIVAELRPVFENIAITFKRLSKIEKALLRIEEKVDMTLEDAPDVTMARLKVVDKKLDSIKSDVEFTYMKVSMNELEIDRLNHQYGCIEVHRDMGLPDYAYRPKIRKQEKIQDSHKSQAYMIENELIGIINDIVGDAWGGKYRFVNEAIKLMIYQVFPEYADRVRVKE